MEKFNNTDENSNLNEEFKGAWIFLSHSHKDIQEVRKIRDALEKQGHNPLMFFLKCLNDDNEITDLIKREIEARNWFLLCNSENAKKSSWVQSEIKHIKKFPDKYWANIEVNSEWKEQLNLINALSTRLRIFLSYHRKDSDIAKKIALFLHQKDLDVHDNESIIINSDTTILGQIRTEIDDSMKNGFFIPLISKNSMNSKYMQLEITYAFSKQGLKNKIIPIFLENSKEFPQDYSLLLSNLSSLTLDNNSFEELMAELVNRIKSANISP